ncbi:MAG: DUF11 domain-containing protein [Ruminococcaceae bacterium]|nr:DUF11 domain-containing protein [Oscillospiraceae bacterium]
MNKRITSIVLCLVMLISLVAAVVPASAAGSTSFKMTADKTEANPGDIITYTVSMGAVENIYSIKLKLVIPEGLTYVEGSGKATTGLQALMNAAKAEFTEATKVFIVGSSNYTSASETVLMQFQCRVNDDATGSLEVGFDIDPENIFDLDYDNIDFTTSTAPVSVIVPCSHDWDAATCTAPKTCKLCGETSGAALGHSWDAATCTAPKTCTVCGETTGSANGHDWAAATCDAPKTCKDCGATEGVALSHDWKAADCENAKTCTLCGKTEGAALGHDWKAADCTTAKTCNTCGKTEGAALGHSWAEATCTVPKTCTVCGFTEGTAGHDWVDATCTEPKTCRVCGETEGEALGHDWVYATCTEPDTCNRCGETQGEALGHHLSEVSDFDEENHWVNCLNCDYKGEVEAHYDEDEDNACDYCGAEMPEEPENPENPENPEDPEEPENPEDKPEEDIPQTADVSMIGFIAILMLAACGLIVINKKNFA